MDIDICMPVIKELQYNINDFVIVDYFNIHHVKYVFSFLYFRFYGGDFLCRTVKYGQVIAMYASSYVIVSTAADRYRIMNE